MTAEEGRGWRWPRVSARLRILGVTMSIVAATLVLSVLLLRALLIRDQAGLNDRRLVQEVEEFTEVAAAVEVPAGVPPGVVAEQIMERYLRTNVPDADESFLTFVAGSPFLASAEAPAPLDDDTWLDATAASVSSRYDNVATSAGSARTLSVPLVVGGSAVGVFSAAVWETPGRERIDRSVRIAALVSSVAMLGAFVVSWSTAGRVLRPLRSLADASRRIRETDLSERIPPGGRDEIGALVEQYNAMLDRLDRSFASQRAFLDDAGHELRTPLTIVRGHAELADTAEGWALARPMMIGELDRMARIVDDLLILAKAERPDFVVVRPTDLVDIVSNTLARGRSLGARSWVDDGAPDVVVMVDQQRIEQAMLNLVSNAVRHTGPDDSISVGARVEADGLYLWVRDSGEGIDPVDQASVFQRFRSSARPGAGGSAGLGLAIVTAIAEAHHGGVGLDSAPGVGSTFTLHLPSSTLA